jgi:hypothetical protein
MPNRTVPTAHMLASWQKLWQHQWFQGCFIISLVLSAIAMGLMPAQRDKLRSVEGVVIDATSLRNVAWTLYVGQNVRESKKDSTSVVVDTRLVGAPGKLLGQYIVADVSSGVVTTHPSAAV